MANGQNEVLFELKPKQSAVFRALFETPGVRYSVLVAGRRFGKTYLALATLLKAATNKAGSKNWYISPTYRQAKENSWNILKYLTPRAWIKNTNETDLSILLRNGSKIALKGAENPDSLRGSTLEFVVFDEFADVNIETWEAVIRPALMTTRGKAFFIGTPKGFNHFKEMFDKSVSTAEESGEWRGFCFTTLEGGYVPPEEVESHKRDTEPRIFRQEYEASFETLRGRVYYRFNRGRNIKPVIDNGGDILIGIDFNVDPMTAVVGVRAGDQLHIIDEIVLRDSNTIEMAREIRKRYSDLPKSDKNYSLLKELGRCQDIPIRPIKVFPDPSGKARKTSAPVGQTDYTILRNAGFQVIAPRSAPPVIDRVNNLNVLLENAAGDNRLFINPKCANLIKCLDGLIYKEGTNQPDKSLGLDHLPDALGYLTWSEFPVLAGRMLTGEIYGTMVG